MHLHLHITIIYSLYSLFFFNDTATTEIYTLSLHDALPISSSLRSSSAFAFSSYLCPTPGPMMRSNFNPSCFIARVLDRKSTRLNSSHMSISYAVFCLKKKKKLIVYDSY